MKKIVPLMPLLLILFSLPSCGRQAAGVKNVIFYEKSGAGEPDGGFSTGGIADGGITTVNGNLKNPVLENAYLELSFLPESAEIILHDKAAGTEWRSNPEANAAAFAGADTVTMQLMLSQFSLQYADVSGVGQTLFSAEHSVERNAFDYALVDGGLEVYYTVGDLERGYMFPAALPEERMLFFLDRMNREDRRKVEASYRLYDINNLREGDNRAALLARYPDLAHGKVYVLRENTQEYMKAEIEGFFTGALYTRDDYSEDSSHYTMEGGTEKPAFNITLRYTLDGRSLVLTVPLDRVAYRPAFPVTQLSLLPFMGAGGLDDEGYLLTPDGSGALIYFNNGKQNQTAYSNNVYGWDEAMPRDAVVSDNKAPYPVFGIQKNGAALLCVIAEGAAYATIRADVSGRNCSWNSIYPRFEMIHGAIMEISGRSDRAVYLYENGLPPGENIVLRYTPCAQVGYVGMAKEYRSWLTKKFPFLAGGIPAGNKEGGIPIAVEIVGAVNKTRHRLGIPFDLPLKLTSYRETESMIRDFAAMGWKNVNIKLNGWFNRSVDHSVPAKIKLISALGSGRDFESLVSAAAESGYELFPEADFLYIRDISPFGGFSLYRDAARYVNRKRIEKYPYSIVWFGERTRWGKISYIARPAGMMAMMDKFSQKAGALGLKNLAYRSMGGKLSGDYNEKRPVSREKAMKMRQEKLSELTQSGAKILVDSGFAYSAPWASFITGMAVTDQGFGITDVSVPFYQIALHGLVPYTGKAINLAEDYTKHLLKTVECGAGLYFSFMTEETAVLQETKFRQFYANEYGKWIQDADALYKKFSLDFAGLYNQAIDDHKILAPGVSMTVYEDGTRVIVNSGAGAFYYKGLNGSDSKNPDQENRELVIEADDYVVLRREG